MADTGCCLRLRFGPNLSFLKNSRWRKTEGITHSHSMLGMHRKRAKWDDVQNRGIGVNSRSSRRPGHRIAKELREVDRVSGRGAIFKTAMSTAREPDEEADEHPENATGAAISSKYPCMYVKKSVSSGEIIKYQGTIVVSASVVHLIPKLRSEVYIYLTSVLKSSFRDLLRRIEVFSSSVWVSQECSVFATLSSRVHVGKWWIIMFLNCQIFK